MKKEKNRREEKRNEKVQKYVVISLLIKQIYSFGVPFFLMLKKAT